MARGGSLLWKPQASDWSNMGRGSTQQIPVEGERKASRVPLRERKQGPRRQLSRQSMCFALTLLRFEPWHCTGGALAPEESLVLDRVSLSLPLSVRLKSYSDG